MSPAKISYSKFAVHFAVMNYHIFGGVEGAGRGGGGGHGQASNTSGVEGGSACSLFANFRMHF